MVINHLLNGMILQVGGWFRFGSVDQLGFRWRALGDSFFRRLKTMIENKTDSVNGQPLNFGGITYLVGKIKFKL